MGEIKLHSLENTSIFSRDIKSSEGGIAMVEKNPKNLRRRNLQRRLCKEYCGAREELPKISHLNCPVLLYIVVHSS